MIQPPASLAARAHIGSLAQYEEMYRRSLADPEGFWREQAEILTWFHPPQQIFDADFRQVDFSWYGGGRLNASFNSRMASPANIPTLRENGPGNGSSQQPATTPISQLGKSVAITCTKPSFSDPSNALPLRPTSPNPSARTPFATASPPTFSTPATTSAPSRNYSVIATSPPP